MKASPILHTRREFLRTALLGGALSWTVPSFLAETFAALQAQAADQATQVTTGRDGPILVVLQMAGGNDGLNTVVPFADDNYYRARPRLSLPQAQLLKLNDRIGLHPKLTGLKALHDAGQLAIIQGAGYPNPNRSHFRSTEIWQTASDPDRNEYYGWIGRYFDNACAGCDPTVGVSIGRQMPQAFAAKDPKGITLDNPRTYRFLAPGHGQSSPGVAPVPRKTAALDLENAFRHLNEADDSSMEFSGATIGSLAGSPSKPGSALDFLERTALEAQVSSDTIQAISSRVINQATYPASQLANSLKLVAQLIGGGLPTRIFYVSQGGYDTHTNQIPTQERLLKDLGDSVRSFVADLQAQGNFARILLLTFSEFGRRVAENASGGTDHGAAAPMFLVGGALNAGLHGQYPSLAPADLFQGDLMYRIDFRSVYATILEHWLRTPSLPILRRQFPLMPVLKT